MSSKRIYHAGILGCGMIGRVHAYAYHTIPFFFPNTPYQIKIRYVCTGHWETARAMQQLVHASKATIYWEEVIEDPKVDIINICLPNDLHFSSLKMAVSHQKHIYCDKPLVATWEEAQKFFKSFPQNYPKIHQMTFQNRFFPATLHAKELINQGKLGPIEHFRFLYLHSGNIDPQAPMRWKLSKVHGGGVINDLGSHLIDLMEWLLGPIYEVCAMSKITYPERPMGNQSVVVDGEDGAFALVKLQNGAQGILEMSKIATGSEDELRFEIHGQYGALRFNLLNPNQLEYYDQHAPNTPYGGSRGWTHIHCGGRYLDLPSTAIPGPKFSIGWLRAHIASLKNFLDGVHSLQHVRPSLLDGIRVQAVLHALHQSVLTQTWQKVPTL